MIAHLLLAQRYADQRCRWCRFVWGAAVETLPAKELQLSLFLKIPGGPSHKCLDTLWIGLGLGVLERGREGMEAETSVMSLGPGPALGEALP